jgi:hypothetical protein
MRKVTREEFYRKVGRLNVHPQIQNSTYPYWSLWKMLGYGDNGKIIGKTVGVYKNGINGLSETEYYLNEN